MHSLFSRGLTSAALFVGFASFASLTAASARAQANLSFSGGMGTPISITLATPISYTVTQAVTNGNGPSPLFRGVGNLFGGPVNVTGTISYTVNGGLVRTINRVSSGQSTGDTALNDVYLFSSVLPGVNVNDTLTLTSGTITTTTAFSSPPPASGSFVTYLTGIVNGTNGVRISNDGVATANTPEPASIALLAMGGAGLCVRAKRLRKKSE